MNLIINIIRSLLTIPMTLSMIEKIESEMGDYEFNYEDNVFDISTGKKL